MQLHSVIILPLALSFVLVYALPSKPPCFDSYANFDDNESKQSHPTTGLCATFEITTGATTAAFSEDLPALIPDSDENEPLDEQYNTIIDKQMSNTKLCKKTDADVSRIRRKLSAFLVILKNWITKYPRVIIALIILLLADSRKIMCGNQYYDAITKSSLLQPMIQYTPLAQDFDVNHFAAKEIENVLYMLLAAYVSQYCTMLKNGDISRPEMAFLVHSGEYLENTIQNFIEYAQHLISDKKEGESFTEFVKNLQEQVENSEFYKNVVSNDATELKFPMKYTYFVDEEESFLELTNLHEQVENSILSKDTFSNDEMLLKCPSASNHVVDKKDLKKPANRFRFKMNLLVILIELGFLCETNRADECLQVLAKRLVVDGFVSQNGMLLLRTVREKLEKPLQTMAKHGNILLVWLVASWIFMIAIIDAIKNHIISAGETLDSITI